MTTEQQTTGETGKGRLRERTKAFAVEIVRLSASLPRTREAGVLGRQVLRSGTSVGAHYREGSRARSTAEFISKLETGIQELDETIYWLELLVECDLSSRDRVRPLLDEANQLTAMLVASVRTAKDGREPSASSTP